MIRVCFHLHSEYSGDSLLSLEKIVEVAEKNKIDVIIITDHDNLVPKEKTEKMDKVRIILGEEIKTETGEITGIFLKEKISPGLSPGETIKKIKEQGGIVIIPHPFDRFRREVLRRKTLLDNLDQIDIIEIFNSDNILNFDNRRAAEFAKKHNKIAIVGSDAHLASEIARTYIEMEDFNGPQDFLAKLKEAKFYTEKSSSLVHVLQTFNKIIKKFKD